MRVKIDPALAVLIKISPKAHVVTDKHINDDLVLLNSPVDYHDDEKYNQPGYYYSEVLLEVVDVVFSKLPMLQTQLCFVGNKNWLPNY